LATKWLIVGYADARSSERDRFVFDEGYSPGEYQVITHGVPRDHKNLKRLRLEIGNLGGLDIDRLPG